MDIDYSAPLVIYVGYVWTTRSLFYIANIAGGAPVGVIQGADPEFTLPNGNFRHPDVCWTRMAVFNAFPPNLGRVNGVPDFIVEVRSPSQRVNDQRDKMGLWISAGVEVYDVKRSNSCQFGILVDYLNRTTY